MRVTNEMQYQTILRNVQNTQAGMARLQEQLSSGIRLQRPSDGPADMVRLLRVRHDDGRIDAHLSNIRDATVALDASTSALTEARNVLTRAKDAALEAANSAVSDPTADEALAQQIDGAIEAMLRIGNRKLSDGQSLFAGTANTTTPFVVTATDAAGRPSQIEYRGTSDSSKVLIGKGETLDTLIPGDVFDMPPSEITTDPPDAFQLLMNVRDTIRNSSGLPEAERNAALTRHLDELDRMSTGVLGALGTQGVQAELLVQWKDRVSDIQLSLKQQTDDLESVDVAKAITELAEFQNLYEVSLSLVQQINSLSLSDFLK